jgi:hypothetical protein
MISSDGFWCSRGFNLNIAKGNQLKFLDKKKLISALVVD